MAKQTATNIVDVWNRTSVIVESGDLSSVEQLTLFHCLIALNRNLWQSTKVNPAIIAAATRKDKRTISSAIDKLVAENILYRTEGGAISIGRHYSYQRGSEQGGAVSTVQPRDNAGHDGGSDGNVTQTKPAGRRRKLFNDTAV